jgi:Zn-dependent peptidase ImmA (M78 family)
MNRNLSKFYPESRNLEIQLKSQEKLEKIEKTKENKKKILKEKKEKIQEKIKEKKKKFLRVKQKEFYIQLELTWFTMITVSTVTNFIFQKILQQKVKKT